MTSSDGKTWFIEQRGTQEEGVFVGKLCWECGTVTESFPLITEEACK